jgi:HKD family nuclease
MKVILAGTSKDFANELNKEFLTAWRISACVAWASTQHDVYDALWKNRTAAVKLVVGTHFYQTEPAFIRAFQNHPGARFVFSGDGLFHPKLYLFEHKNGRRNLFIGSSNFTRGGLGENVEANVKVTFEKDEEHSCLTQAAEFIDDIWNSAQRPSNVLLERYEAQWKKREPHRRALGGTGGKKKKTSKSSAEVIEANWSWSEFVKKVRGFDSLHPQETRLRGRLDLLDEARHLFKTHGFAEMTREERRCLAGTINTSEGDLNKWQAFGTMVGNGHFHHEVVDDGKTKGLSAALQNIPLTGDISSEHFSKFVETFRKVAHPRVGIGCATRLLAMRRPDYFICFTDRNKDHVKKAFGIKGNLELEDYWTEVVERVMGTLWWNEQEPGAALEKRIWRCRAALMDNIFYG